MRIEILPEARDDLIAGFRFYEHQAPGLVLDRITDEVGEDENHPLASLMDVLGVLIQKYEDEHVPELTQ